MAIWGLKENAGRRYQPSNGTEGGAFIDAWCSNCERDKVMNGTATDDEAMADDSLYCDILSASMRDTAGVPQWIYGDDGIPKCTAFTPQGEAPAPARCPHTMALPLEDAQIIQFPGSKP